MNWFNRQRHKFHFNTIRKQLLLVLLLMTLLPILAASVGSLIIGYSNGRQFAIEQLESLLSLKEQEISVWTDGLKRELTTALEQEYIYDRMSVVLRFARDDYYLDFYNKSVRLRMQRFLLNAQYFDEIFLLDLDGNVALSTNTGREGQNYQAERFFSRGLEGKSVELAIGFDNPSTYSVITVMPVQDTDGRTIGILAGKAGSPALSVIMSRKTGLGSTGRSYLAGAEGFVIAAIDETDPRAKVLSATAAQLAASRSHGIEYYINAQGTQVVGAFQWLPDLDLMLFIERDIAEVFTALPQIMKVNLVVALISVLLSVGATMLITRRIAIPIMELSQRADGIARGDWSQISHVDRKDELGVLARALDSMMIQLRELINNLEQRIEKRTRQLQDANQALREANQSIHRRALQLEASSNVSREITAILDGEELLQRIARLIREEFGFYAVQIFMADENMTRLTLEAFNYESSAKPCSSEVLLKPACASLNGAAVQQNGPVLVNDIQQELEYPCSEVLPGARSELVIPLRIVGRLIGTLDIQSAVANSFNPEDLPVLQNLGDQIAIAIENTRLYENNKKLAVLEERNRLARELHDSVIQSLYSLTLLEGGWKRFSPQEKAESAEEFMEEFSEIARQSLKEMRLLVYNLRPPLLEQEGLVGALHARLDAVEKRAGIETRLLADDLTCLDMPTQVGIYGIAQEALNNVLKHAHASHVMLQFSIRDGKFKMTIHDNGQGFSMEEHRLFNGLGLISMQERAVKINGVLNVASKAGGGTTVSLQIPLDEKIPGG